MRGLVLLLIAAGMIWSCSSGDKSAKTEESPTVNVEPQALLSNEESIEVTPTVEKRNEVVRENISAKRLLNKRINAESFEADIMVIEQSGVYSPEICQSLRESYLNSKSYSSNVWSMTYKDALDAVQAGIERAKRMEEVKNRNSYL